MTGTRYIAAPPRATVRIPTASGEEIEAWVYRPEDDGPHPAVVMAHGLAAVKAGGLAPFAERFCAAGFTTVAFDYRKWGGSSGLPRDETSVPRQRADYRTVIDWVIAEPDIDETQIFIWGTSFSGLHVVEIAATDARLRGAIAQNPLVDGLAAVTMAPLRHALHLMGIGVVDRLGSAFGSAPRYIPAGVAPGEFGAVANAAAAAGVEIIRPKDGTEWHNRVAARSMLGVAAHRPARKAAEVRCPILLVVAEDDTIAPVEPALHLAELAPRAELFRSRGGHYGVYDGGEDYHRVVAAEVEFLRRHSHTLAP
jgi:dipeptidyl aminopeptidase/acylaminoacyl peptidase